MTEQTTPYGWIYIGFDFLLNPNIGLMLYAKWRLGYSNNGVQNPDLMIGGQELHPTLFNP